MAVGVVGSTSVDEQSEYFSGLDVSPGVVLLSTTKNASCVILDCSGTRLMQRAPVDPDDSDFILDGRDDDAAQWILTEFWRRGIGRRNVLVIDDTDPLQMLVDQQVRRARHELPYVIPERGWGLERAGFDINNLRVNASAVRARGWPVRHQWRTAGPSSGGI